MEACSIHDLEYQGSNLIAALWSLPLRNVCEHRIYTGLLYVYSAKSHFVAVTKNDKQPFFCDKRTDTSLESQAPTHGTCTTRWCCQAGGSGNGSSVSISLLLLFYEPEHIFAYQSHITTPAPTPQPQWMASMVVDHLVIWDIPKLCPKAKKNKRETLTPKPKFWHWFSPAHLLNNIAL